MSQALALKHPKPASTTEQLAGNILRVVLRHGNTLDAADAFHGRHLRKIVRAIEAGRTVDLVLPAFPAKSPNREKTLGPLPDLAEVLGLERLQKICDEIAALHAPGARVVICSDGRVFSDLVLVSDEEVTAYGQSLRAIIREEGFSSLTTFSMENVFAGGEQSKQVAGGEQSRQVAVGEQSKQIAGGEQSKQAAGGTDFDGMRARLANDFGRGLEELREEIRTSPSSRAMFNGVHRFIFEDRLAIEPQKTRNRLREESKEIAYRVIQRSNAWSSLVEQLFPHALRLSIHPQFSSSPKIGFQLVKCENAWGTPWHNVALFGEKGFRLVKRREAEELGATLALARGKYAYYRERGL